MFRIEYKFKADRLSYACCAIR